MMGEAKNDSENAFPVGSRGDTCTFQARIFRAREQREPAFLASFLDIHV